MASIGVTVCQCGCSELDTDPARGDVVCTKCGTVLETSLIVSEVQFEESASGVASAVGQFVSGDGRVGKSLPGLYTGMSKVSRELTFRNAKRKISQLCAKLQLNQHCQDTAFNFFKMALHRRLTAGRKNDLVVAACIYITCRTEGTSHLLIDFCDTLKVGVYELGRTFLKLSSELHINIPAIDPCLYILRFAHKLEFGSKTHKVSMTALRLVQRMKRDWLHTGRRPSGVCGAALLLAARLHQFNRTIVDIVKIVKVHQSTVRKRLLEFGETPTSSLTLNEFMTVDLEEEQDPPAFKAARRKDKEVNPPDVSSKEFLELQGQIEKLLADGKRRSSTWESYMSDLERSAEQENRDIMEFITGETRESISNIIGEEIGSVDKKLIQPAIPADEDDCKRLTSAGGLGPSLQMLGLLPSKSETDAGNENVPSGGADDGILELEGIDDKEIDSYLLNNEESRLKSMLWAKVNAEYLREQRAKAKFLAENPMPPAKARKKARKKRARPIHAHTPGEAIEKMLQEKKISSKINYDVLRNLRAMNGPDEQGAEDSPDSLLAGPSKVETDISLPGTPLDGDDGSERDSGAEDVKDSVFARPTSRAPSRKRKAPKQAPKLAVFSKTVVLEDVKPKQVDSGGSENNDVKFETLETESVADDGESEHDAEDMDEEELSAAQLLQQHRREVGDDFEVDDDYY